MQFSLPTIYLLPFKQKFSRALSVITVSNPSSGILPSVYYNIAAVLTTSATLLSSRSSLHSLLQTDGSLSKLILLYVSVTFITVDSLHRSLNAASFNFMTPHYLNFLFFLLLGKKNKVSSFSIFFDEFSSSESSRDIEMA